MILMCSPFRRASMAAWSRRLFLALCRLLASSLESRCLRLLLGRSGPRREVPSLLGPLGPGNSDVVLPAECAGYGWFSWG